MARLRQRVTVATCIACGARSRAGDCPDGCADVPLDLVAAAAVDALAARVAALAVRARECRAVLEMLRADPSRDWGEVRAAAIAALRTPVPEAPPPEEVVEAWGCPECGRVDAPQPCLDVCVRRPVSMADAAEYRELAVAAAQAECEDERLEAVVRLVAQLTPRPGSDERNRAALNARAAALLQDRDG